MILGRALEQFGYTVLPAGNGREAMDKVQQELPELAVVLVDWNMPEMNGLEFVQAFRRLPRYQYQQVPLMMVTAETDTGQMTKALSAGANEYVMKPFTDEVLAGKLRILGLLNDCN